MVKLKRSFMLGFAALLLFGFFANSNERPFICERLWFEGDDFVIYIRDLRDALHVSEEEIRNFANHYPKKYVNMIDRILEKCDQTLLDQIANEISRLDLEHFDDKAKHQKAH